MLQAELDGGWPLSLRLHASGSASWQSVFYPYGTQHDFRSDISLSYLVGELLRLGVHCVPRYEAKEDTSSRSWTRVYSASAWLSGTWYVEDRFTVTTSVGLGNGVRTRHGYPPLRNLSTYFNVDFSYRIR
jgi:outer membrane phospholipase A